MQVVRDIENLINRKIARNHQKLAIFNLINRKIDDAHEVDQHSALVFVEPLGTSSDLNLFLLYFSVISS
jgi:hypothetical protein